MNRSMKLKYRKANRKGFTLVELIVVLVILAILAAILVPALLGYIDRARTRQDMLEAKNCITAAQAEFSSLYAIQNGRGTDQVCVIPVSKNKLKIDGKTDSRDKLRNNDIYAFKNKSITHPQYKEFTQKILSTAGYENEADYPYYLIVAAGHYEKYIDTDPHKPFTIYFAMYQRTKDSKPIFFDGNKWKDEYPKSALDNTASQQDKDYNVYNINGQSIKLQYYILCNQDTTKNWWTALEENSKNR